MPKLICGLSKTKRDPFGRRTASVSVEVELDAATIRDSGKLKQHIRCGFDRIREAIEEELARAGSDEMLSGTNGRSHHNGRSTIVKRPR